MAGSLSEGVGGQPRRPRRLRRRPACRFAGLDRSLGYDNQLSKRTDTYVMVRADDTRAAGSAVDASGTSYAVGIRHRF